MSTRGVDGRPSGGRVPLSRYVKPPEAGAGRRGTQRPDAERPAAAGTGIGPRRRRDTGVESNARLTATTGILLLVMLAAEGLTIVSIHPLLSWHIAIGLALVPPVGLKIASTLWRFAHYYLGDARYRRAGPPVLLLRVIGPFVTLTTVAVLATGVATWLIGPDHRIWLTLHQASFVVWFGVMTLHVLGHVGKAGRLAAADVAPAAVRAEPVPRARTRQGLVLLSLAAGLVVALATRGVASGWTSFVHPGH